MAGFRTFANNDLLTAADVNGFLMRQVVAQVLNEAERNAIPLPDQGMLVHRRDKAWIEQYFAIYNAVTNPGGATAAGWYPIAGQLPAAFAAIEGAQALAANVEAVVAFTAAVVRVRNVAFNDATDQFTVPVAGLYRLRGEVTFQASGAATRALYLNIGGSTVKGGVWSGMSGIDTVVVERTLELPAAAVVTMTALSTVAGGLYVAGGAYASQLSIEYVGAK